jgi:hypothetical protein
MLKVVIEGVFVPKKITIEDVREWLKEHHAGCVLLSQQYVSGREKIDIICERGHFYEGTFDAIKYQGHWCRKCGRIKFKETMINKYGCEHALQNKEIYKKMQETTFDSLGCIHNFQNKDVQEKRKQTWMDIHGCDNPLKSFEVQLKKDKTNTKKYGCRHPMQNHEVALNIAKKTNNPSTKIHWKTREECHCQGGYEPKVIDYFNENKIDFLWQPETFALKNGSTYRPDCYLVDQNLWVEIKGFKREDGMAKWEEFHEKHKNSELWDRRKLEEMGIL